MLSGARKRWLTDSWQEEPLSMFVSGLKEVPVDDYAPERVGLADTLSSRSCSAAFRTAQSNGTVSSRS